MVHKEGSDDNFGLYLRREVLVVIIQSALLIGGFIAGYASLRTEVQQLRSTVEQHIAQSSEFVREDVWKTRNTFIDQKLDKIEAKLDLLLAHQMDLVRKETAKK